MADRRVGNAVVYGFCGCDWWRLCRRRMGVTMDYMLDIFQDGQVRRGDLIDGAQLVAGRSPGMFEIAQRLASGGHAMVDMFARGAPLNRWP